MTTPRTRVVVSLATTLSLTLAFGACVRNQPHPSPNGPATIERTPPAMRFDNTAREHVHVYLVSDERQWLLGRVEPGAWAMLRIPEEALGMSPRNVQLAVIVGGRIATQVARDPRATFTIAQPAAAILSLRWTITHGQLQATTR